MWSADPIDYLAVSRQISLDFAIEALLKIVVLERELIFTLENILLLIFNIAVSTKNFTVEGLIKKLYKFAYRSFLENGNYLESNIIENPLILYLAITTK